MGKRRRIGASPQTSAPVSGVLRPLRGHSFSLKFFLPIRHHQIRATSSLHASRRLRTCSIARREARTIVTCSKRRRALVAFAFRRVGAQAPAERSEADSGEAAVPCVLRQQADLTTQPRARSIFHVAVFASRCLLPVVLPICTRPSAASPRNV